MRTGAAASAVQAIVALACALAALPAAQAQDIRITAPSAATSASPPTDDPQASQPLTPEESAALSQALLFDPANLAAPKSARPLRLPTWSKPHDLSVNGTQNPDGTSKVAVKQPLATTDWDADVGADLKTAAPPPTSFGLASRFPERSMTPAPAPPGPRSAYPIWPRSMRASMPPTTRASSAPPSSIRFRSGSDSR